MIQKLSHTNLLVQDQDIAKEFYANKLGFEVRMDQTMGNGFRWLTVAPRGQDLQIVLMKIAPSQFADEEAAAAVRVLLRKGILGGGVFQTGDCRKTYADLVAKGVEFQSPPTERFYGVEAMFKDGQGNWFSLTEPRNTRK